VDDAAAVGGVANGSGNVESKKKRKKKKRKQSVTSESANGLRLGHEREHANVLSRAERKKDRSHPATMLDGSGDPGGVSTKVCHIVRGLSVRLIRFRAKKGKSLQCLNGTFR
jgi:hypothetical protein